tara:strand:- start:91 stop:447 length:357 start_codon:yes stop_codon:yes gene_type:complete
MNSPQNNNPQKDQWLEQFASGNPFFGGSRRKKKLRRRRRPSGGLFAGSMHGYLASDSLEGEPEQPEEDNKYKNVPAIYRLAVENEAREKAWRLSSLEKMLWPEGRVGGYQYYQPEGDK